LPPQVKRYNSVANTWEAVGAPLGNLASTAFPPLAPSLGLSLSPSQQLYVAYSCGMRSENRVCAASGASTSTPWAALPEVTGFQSSSLALAVADDGAVVLAFRAASQRMAVYWLPVGASAWAPYFGDASSTQVSDGAVYPCVSLTLLLGTQPVVAYHDSDNNRVEVKRHDGTAWSLVGGEALVTSPTAAPTCPSIDAYTQSEVSIGTGPVTYTVTSGVWAAYRDDQPTGLAVRRWDLEGGGAWSAPSGNMRAATDIIVASFALATERDIRNRGYPYFGTYSPCIAYTNAAARGYMDCMRNDPDTGVVSGAGGPPARGGTHMRGSNPAELLAQHRHGQVPLPTPTPPI
jgi:hypothetical protein